MVVKLQTRSIYSYAALALVIILCHNHLVHYVGLSPCLK